jgi:hypothetical protein
MSFISKWLGGQLNGKIDSKYVLDVRALLSTSGCSLCALILRKFKRGVQPAISPSLRPQESQVLNPQESIDVSINYNNIVSLKHQHRSEILDLELAHLPYEYFVSNSTNSEECWGLARKWLHACRSGHDCKSVSSRSPLPKRLIKINASLDGLKPCLVESDQYLKMVEYLYIKSLLGEG